MPVTEFFLLVVEVLNDDSDEQVQREKRAKYDEKHKVQEHVDVLLPLWLLVQLKLNFKGSDSRNLKVKF